MKKNCILSLSSLQLGYLYTVIVGLLYKASFRLARAAWVPSLSVVTARGLWGYAEPYRLGVNYFRPTDTTTGRKPQVVAERGSQNGIL